jgi:hypothetical protein
VTADGTVLLSETPRRAIPLSPCHYLDEGSQENSDFQVYERGQIAGLGHQVGLYEFDAAGNLLDSWSLLTDTRGRITHPIIADSGWVGFFVPAFSASEVPRQGNGPDPQVNTYSCVRVRPADKITAAMEPTWDNVYAHVLANWNAMAPCMDNWLRLDDPVQVTAFAPLLTRLTDPGVFESFRFMPVTRDMSMGERALLLGFLSAPHGASAPPNGTLQQQPTLIQRSRALRSP